MIKAAVPLQDSRSYLHQALAAASGARSHADDSGKPEKRRQNQGHYCKCPDSFDHFNKKLSHGAGFNDYQSNNALKMQIRRRTLHQT